MGPGRVRDSRRGVRVASRVRVRVRGSKEEKDGRVQKSEGAAAEEACKSTRIRVRDGEDERTSRRRVRDSKGGRGTGPGKEEKDGRVLSGQVGSGPGPGPGRCK